MEEIKNAYKILVGNSEGKEPRRTFEGNNIKMDLKEIGRKGVNYIDLDQDRDQWRVPVNTVMNHLVQ
jgi:hypothetical protein